MKFIYISFCLLLLGCKDHLTGTVKVCNKNLYEELYDEYVGMSDSFLTDSVNFRISIGRYDPKTNFYKYNCNGDTVVVQKWQHLWPQKKDSLIETKVYSLILLMKEHKSE